MDGGKGDPFPGALSWFADRDGDSLALSAAEVGAEVQRVAGGTLVDLTKEGQLPPASEVVALRDRLAALGWVPKPRP